MLLEWAGCLEHGACPAPEGSRGGERGMQGGSFSLFVFHSLLPLGSAGRWELQVCVWAVQACVCACAVRAQLCGRASVPEASRQSSLSLTGL